MLIIMVIICTLVGGQTVISETEKIHRATIATYFTERDFHEIPVVVEIKEAKNHKNKDITIIQITDNGKKYTRKFYCVPSDKEGFTHMAQVEVPSIKRQVEVYFSL